MHVLFVQCISNHDFNGTVVIFTATLQSPTSHGSGRWSWRYQRVSTVHLPTAGGTRCVRIFVMKIDAQSLKKLTFCHRKFSLRGHVACCVCILYDQW